MMMMLMLMVITLVMLLVSVVGCPLHDLALDIAHLMHPLGEFSSLLRTSVDFIEVIFLRTGDGQ